MKSLILAGILSIFLAGAARAERQGAFPDFTNVSTMSIVGVTGSSWTLISSYPVTNYPSPDRTNPTAYFMDLAPQAPNNILVAFTTAPAAPGTTFYGYTYKPSDVPWILSFDKAIYIWAISDTVTEQILYQQFR